MNRYLTILLGFLLIIGCGGGGGGTVDGGGAAPTSPPPASEPAPLRTAIRITNSYAISVTAIYLVPASDTYWGSNLLGSATIHSGESFEYTLGIAGIYKLEIVFSDGTQKTLLDLNIVANQTTQVQITAGTGSLIRTALQLTSTLEESNSITVAEMGTTESPDTDAEIIVTIQ